MKFFAALLLAAGLAFASRETGREAPRLGDAIDVARADLAATERALRRKPTDPSLLLQRLRLLHVLSVQEEARLPEARAALNALAAASPGSVGSQAREKPLYLAYAGALDVVEARHGFWPRERMEPLKRGLPRLDSATALDPGNAEIRYLRLTSCYYLPFFLGRKGSVKEDFEALASGLPAQRDRFPARWYLAVSGFVLEKGDVEGDARAALRRARDEVAAKAAAEERGGGG